MNKERILNIIGSIFNFIIYSVLFILLFMIASTRLSGQNPEILSHRVLTVLSGSMEPGIKTGSIIAINTTENPTSFEEDDVITFVTEQEVLVTHRIVEVQDDGETYITKGDANDGLDPEPVRAVNIVGVYTGLTIPFIGYISSFLNTNLGISLFLIAPGVLLVIYSIFTVFKMIFKKEA